MLSFVNVKVQFCICKWDSINVYMIFLIRYKFDFKKKNQIKSPNIWSCVQETGSDPPIGSDRDSRRDKHGPSAYNESIYNMFKNNELLHKNYLLKALNWNKINIIQEENKNSMDVFSITIAANGKKYT